MSDTTIDMAKVTQMLDAGWHVRIYKNDMGSYEVRGRHAKARILKQTRDRLLAGVPPESVAAMRKSAEDIVHEYHVDGFEIASDDFTPEQALTRLAYKCVDGLII